MKISLWTANCNPCLEMPLCLVNTLRKKSYLSFKLSCTDFWSSQFKDHTANQKDTTYNLSAKISCCIYL